MMGIPDVDPTLDTRYRRVLHRFSTLRFSTWMGRRISPYVDPTMMRRSGGRYRLSWGVKLVMLTHTGAKSGVARDSCMAYFTDAGRVVLIASNYGQNHNPGWYYNVKAHPRVTLTGGGIEANSSSTRPSGTSVTGCSTWPGGIWRSGPATSAPAAVARYRCWC